MTSPETEPLGQAALEQALAHLGVAHGTTLAVHSSLSRIGWVVGGAPTVVRALIATLGEDGTLVMPAATPECADPASWARRDAAAAWIERVRAELPPFDARTTPTTLGAIPETFRNWPETLRSDHPLESVCARGPAASRITVDHPLEFSEGPGSPWDKLHDLDAQVLLLGVGFDRCTALHYAESLAPNRRTASVRFPSLTNGKQTWVEVRNVADDNGTHFPRVGERFLELGGARSGPVGAAPSLLFSLRDLVACAVPYFESEL